MTYFDQISPNFWPKQFRGQRTGRTGQNKLWHGKFKLGNFFELCTVNHFINKMLRCNIYILAVLTNRNSMKYLILIFVISCTSSGKVLCSHLALDFFLTFFLLKKLVKIEYLQLSIIYWHCKVKGFQLFCLRF